MAERSTSTKPSLAAVSHALERTALELGSSAVVIGTFQHAAYFRPRARSYGALERAGVTTLVAYAGDGAEAPVHHVVVGDRHPLTSVWAAVLVSDDLCGYVHAVDGHQLGDTTRGIERARLFDAEVGFDQRRARSIARHLLADLQQAGLPDDIATSVRDRLAGEPAVASSSTEAAWRVGMETLVDRLQRVSSELSEEQRRATTDALTGVANRRGVMDWAGASEEADLPTPPIGVLLLDLAGFKTVNDTLGHAAGDEMLRRVARAIEATIRHGDLVARWGGDEFVVLCPGLDDEVRLAALGRRIVDAVDEIELGGLRARIDFGAEVTRRRPFRFEVADAALYESRRMRSAAAGN